MIKQTKPTHEELAVIKRLLDASKCINGKVLLPIRTAIDIAFENGDIREKYPERLVADLLTQPQPVIEFIKWFSRNYQIWFYSTYKLFAITPQTSSKEENSEEEKTVGKKIRKTAPFPSLLATVISP